MTPPVEPDEVTWHAYFDGTLPDARQGFRNRTTRKTFSSDRPFPYQVDGDFLGHVRSLDFRYEPDAIRLIVP